jgi:TPR repeat protein
MYLGGEGVPVDLVRSQAWRSLAADQGHELAGSRRTEVESRMTAAQLEDASKEAERLRKSLQE